MTRTDCPFGFRVVGPVTEPRRLVDAAAAFAAHAGCDPRADPGREAYLSAFRYGPDFRTHIETRGTPKGFAGPSWSPWLWLDIDRAGLDAALADTRRLVGVLLERYRKFDEDDVLVLFSGRKGFHVGVPLTHNPDPAAEFPRTCRRLAEGLARAAGVAIDPAIYDRVRCLRAPNSRHPGTGLFKRRFSFDEVMHLPADRIVELAREPIPFDLPVVGELVAELENDWDEAARQAEAGRRDRGDAGPGRLQRDTAEFLRGGAADGERHTRLFRAAANLREFAAPDPLIHALLTEPALDSGLPPAEVARVIRCGIDHADRRRTEGGAP